MEILLPQPGSLGGTASLKGLLWGGRPASAGAEWACGLSHTVVSEKSGGFSAGSSGQPETTVQDTGGESCLCTFSKS